MENESFHDQCADLTQEFKIKIPCKLAERVESYAKANKTSMAVVVIEALDVFLREQRSKAG